MDNTLKDERFAHVARDPKFRRIPKSERKVKIDKRFQSMFEDKNFAVKYTVDKRGRPINQSSKENLKKYYDLPSDEENEKTDDVSLKKKVKDKKSKKKDQVEVNLSTDAKLSSPKISKNNVQTQETKKKTKNEKSAKVKAKNDVKSKKEKSLNFAFQTSKKNSDVEEDSTDDDEVIRRDSNKKTKSLGKYKENTTEEENNDSYDDNESDEEEIDDEEMDEEESDDEESDSDLEQNVSESNDEDQQTKTENPLSSILSKKKNKRKNLSENVENKLRDLKVDYARGEGILFSDSSSSDEDDSDVQDDEEDELIHAWGEFDKDAETTEEITHRLAICNMDWDRIRAVDLIVLFSSFLPKGHIINSISIYPSEFGLQRMKEEEIKGPKELVEQSCEKEDGNEEEEGSSFHREKMRQYQLNRLKYYYAIIDCDSPESADKIYTECDGTEFELTGAKIDLRFVPDDTLFDQEPREVCDKLPELTKYKPRQFTTTALQQVKVDLTWDETDPNRVEIFEKLNAGKFDEVDDNELRNYLASGSSSEEESEPKDEKATGETTKTKKKSTIEKYKELLKNIEEEEEKQKKNKNMELEISWDTEVKEKAKQLVEDSIKNSEELTPFEKFIEKRKEKKKAKREEKKKLKNEDNNEGSDSEDSIPSDVNMNDPYFAEEMQSTKKSSKKRKIYETEKVDSDDERRKAELELLLLDKEEDKKKHFNMKKIEEIESMSKSKKKRLEKKNKKVEMVDDFEVDVKDPRFAAIYSSHHYNIDPSDPHYRKTKGTKAFVEEKINKRDTEENLHDSQKDKNQTNKLERKQKSLHNAELSALVKSVKRKASDLKKKK